MRSCKFRIAGSLLNFLLKRHLRTPAEDGTIIYPYRFINKLLVRPEHRCRSPKECYGKAATAGCCHPRCATHLVIPPVRSAGAPPLDWLRADKLGRRAETCR